MDFFPPLQKNVTFCERLFKSQLEWLQKLVISSAITQFLRAEFGIYAYSTSDGSGQKPSQAIFSMMGKNLPTLSKILTLTLAENKICSGLRISWSYCWARAGNE